MVVLQPSDQVLSDIDSKAVLLVGGFGSSKYLHKRLKDAYPSKCTNGKGGVQVLKVMNGSVSIAPV